jgi:hypothetical protein
VVVAGELATFQILIQTRRGIPVGLPSPQVLTAQIVRVSVRFPSMPFDRIRPHSPAVRLHTLLRHPPPMGPHGPHPSPPCGITLQPLIRLSGASKGNVGWLRQVAQGSQPVGVALRASNAQLSQFGGSYSLNVSGSYSLAIKLGSEHIQDSEFAIKVRRACLVCRLVRVTCLVGTRVLTANMHRSFLLGRMRYCAMLKFCPPCNWSRAASPSLHATGTQNTQNHAGFVSLLFADRGCVQVQLRQWLGGRLEQPQHKHRCRSACKC